MNLNKDKIQKIILGIILLIGLLYWLLLYVDWAVRGNGRRVRSKPSRNLRPGLQMRSQNESGKVARLEKNAPKTEETLRQIRSMIPPGEPWLLGFRHSDDRFFEKKRHLKKCVMRAGGETGGGNLEGFNKVLWNLLLTPAWTFIKLGNCPQQTSKMTNRFWKSNSLRIDELGGDVRDQSVSINISTIVKKCRSRKDCWARRNAPSRVLVEN